MNKNNPLVSIIVPVFNAEKYIERCIKSLIFQTYKNLEIILINDCSTDQSEKYCLDFCRKDKRIKYIRNKKNLGIATVRNIGLSEANGKYIMFLDSDDFVEICAVEKMLTICMENSADWVVCKNDIFINNKRMATEKLDDSIKVISNEEAFKRMMDEKDKMRAVWAKLMKRDIIDKLRFPDGCRFGEDMYFMANLIVKSNKIVLINSPFYIYNQENESLVRSAFNESKLQMIDMAQYWTDLCKKFFPNLLVQAKAEYYAIVINLCSYIDMEHQRCFIQIKNKIRRNLKEIVINRNIRKNDKIKALLISCLSLKHYLFIRNILV